MKAVVVQEWLETETGWGCRPDGFSVHLTATDCQAYCKQHWDIEKRSNSSGAVPHVYSRECGNSQLIDVPDNVFDKLIEAKNNKRLGVRVWCRDIKKIHLEKEFRSNIDLAVDKAALLDKEKSAVQIWTWAEAPLEFKRLVEDNKYNWIVYVNKIVLNKPYPIKRASHTKSLPNHGEVRFMK